MKHSKSERGAAAVEFALVVPVLLLLLVGIIEFAHVFNTQISLTQAAREAARTMAVENDQGAATLAAVKGSPGLSPAIGSVTFSSPACAAGSEMTATITYTMPTLTGLFGSSMNLTGVGAMRCGG